MNKVFAYVRVSTVKQGEKGVSLQEQRDAIVRYCERESLEIVEWFEERQTAAKSGRPVFGQMLSRLRQGKASGIVIHKIDRSARNLRDWAKLGELIDRGIKIHFANEGLDLHTRGGRLSADIQAVVAADYIRNLREESRKGFYGRLKQGFYPLPAPLGYLDNGGGAKKTLDPSTAPSVKRAFDLYATGRYTLDTLRAELHQSGLRNRHGTSISLNGISRLLNNPFYTGLIRLARTREVFEGNHEPLISRIVFDRVQAILTGRTPVRTRRNSFLYRKLITCRHCGYTMSGECQKGHTYYRCHSRTCPTKGVREEAIDVAVVATLGSLEFSDRERKKLTQLIDAHRASWLETKAGLTKALELRIKRVTDRLNRLTDAYLDQAIDRKMYEERKENLIADRMAAEKARTELESSANDVLYRVREIFERANSAPVLYEMALKDTKRELLGTLTSNLAVNERNVVVELSSPFDIIANRRKPTNGDPYRGRLRTLEAMLAGVIKHCRTNVENMDMVSEGGQEEDYFSD
ncbi:MAG: recombinase [Candidatus Hydrogenedentota bacterium]